MVSSVERLKKIWGSDMMQLALVVLLLDYVFLFGLETILPGFVMGVFNLNWLLALIFFIWGMNMLVLREKAKEKKMFSFDLVLFFGLAAFIFFVLVVCLYRADYWEVGTYLILSIAVGSLLFKSMEE